MHSNPQKRNFRNQKKDNSCALLPPNIKQEQKGSTITNTSTTQIEESDEEVLEPSLLELELLLSATTLNTNVSDTNSEGTKSNSIVSEGSSSEGSNLLINSLMSKISASVKGLKNEWKKIEKEKRKVEEEKKKLEDEKKKIEEEKKKVEEEKKSLQRIKRSHGNNSTMTKQSKRVKLNVGGKIYHTSISTLVKYPTNTMLGAMFSGRYNVEQEEDGSFFIDRDGENFNYVLNFLRDGVVNLPRNSSVLANLKQESQFYGLTDLTKQISEFELVNDLIYQRKTYNSSAERRALIVDSMKAYPLNTTLQLLGLRELQKLAINEVSEKDIVIVEESNGTSWILDLMEKYKYTSKELITECVKALSILSQNVENCNTIAEESGIGLIFDAMRSYPNDSVIQIHSCGVLWSLTYKDEMCDVIVDQKKDLELVLSCMERYSDCLELQVNACATLWNLAYIEPKIVGTLREKGLELILKAMRNYPTNLTVQRKAIGVLENLDAKDKTYVRIAKKGGLLLILTGMERYPNNPDLQTGACGTLCNLAANPDIKKELKTHSRCQCLIQNASRRFKVKEADELLEILSK